MAENLNIKVDMIIGKNISISKSIHIRNTPMVVYINKTYIPNNIRKEIRAHYWTEEVARFLKAKYRRTQQILGDIEWDQHSSFIQKQRYSQKKTTIKYINRWLTSGSKSFGQNFEYSYYKNDGYQYDHDRFITCEFDIEMKEARMKVITEKIKVLLSPKLIYEGICRGIIKYYKNTTRKGEKRNNRNPIDVQKSIGSQHFCSGRVSKKLTSAMIQRYMIHPNDQNFAGKGWTKEIIESLWEIV